ncbi:hypothetical protein KTR66_17000 [Roseococcus sp. SDR]|uniref:hypothetical protein n=1 Tax=Roseococcus sp. SDR TaxID=2835532 RepID=UPI001BCC16DF|nr:hypothetical protein [Roseococcus sp. SDR]MBS7791705.1 hypothetical protein [Roseococcus sp. SDR]MBV1847019.1 hypothetical protein [Roseococcus sp. SDR]
MNSFDRPRNIVIDPRGASVEGLGVPTASGAAVPDISSDHMSWIALTDLERSTFHLRAYGGRDDVKFDLTTMIGIAPTRSIPLASLSGAAAEGTASLIVVRQAAPGIRHAPAMVELQDSSSWTRADDQDHSGA